jgi:hypothetical protein
MVFPQIGSSAEIQGAESPVCSSDLRAAWLGTDPVVGVACSTFVDLRILRLLKQSIQIRNELAYHSRAIFGCSACILSTNLLALLVLAS